MLPEFLFSRYKQYKTDTEKIATWLAQAATKCGYQSRSESSSSPSAEDAAHHSKQPKLKGRARKLARDAAAAEKKASAGGPNAKEKGTEQKHVVTVREFELMAEHIAKSEDASLKIPKGFIKLIKRCIMTRRGTSDWFDANASTEEEDGSTDRHLHFADVLQRTLLKLAPLDELLLSKPQGEETGNTSATADSMDIREPNNGLINAFSVLQVDETEDDDDEFEITAAIVPATSGGKGEVQQKVRYVVEAEDDGEEWFFALHCFFFDMHELRIYLSCLWSLYKTGQIDLSTVAVTTNTALDLMRRAEDDFQKTMRIPKEYQNYSDGDVTELYYIDSCLRAGVEPRNPEAKKGGKMVDVENWSLVQESFLLPYRSLGTFGKGSDRPGQARGPKMPVTRPAWLGTYDSTLDRTQADADRLCEQDTGLLADFLTIVGPYVSVGDTPCDDELMKGIEKLLSKGKLPLWLVFAAQNFLDIRTILKTEAERPLADLQQFAVEAGITLKEHFDFFEEHSLTGYRTKKSEGYVRQSMNEIADWGLGDKITKILNKEISAKKQTAHKVTGKTREWQPNELLKMHPLLCGMMKYSFHLQLQWEGVRLINETLIMSAAHLYNALQQGNYLPETCLWEDMHTLLEIHPPQDVFIGDYPTTIEDCTRRLALYQGVSPQTFARNRRSGGHRVIYSKNGGRFLKQSSPIASVFRDRFLNNGDVDLSIQSVEVLLGRNLEDRQRNLEKLKEYLEGLSTDKRKESTQSKSKDKNVSNDVESADHAQEALDREGEKAEQAATMVEATEARLEEDEERPLDGHEKEEPGKPADHSAHVRWKKHRQLSLFQFLEELSEGLNDEFLHLQFDYFGFHCRTWRLLEAIQAAVLPILNKKLDDNVFAMAACADGVTIIPGIIMNLACDARNAPNMEALSGAMDTDDEALKAAADVMKEFIEREGAVETERQMETLMQQQADHKIDAETRRALDAIESIRAATGAVPVMEDSDLPSEVEGMARRLLDETTDSDVD